MKEWHRKSIRVKIYHKIYSDLIHKSSLAYILTCIKYLYVNIC